MNAVRALLLGLLAVAYAVGLVAIVASLAWTAPDDAARYVAALAQRRPDPVEPLPIVHRLEAPDIHLARDPFAPSAAAPATASAADPSTLQPIGTWQEGGQVYVLARDAAGARARLSVGDRCAAGAITRIEPGRVTVESAGSTRILDLGAPAPRAPRIPPPADSAAK